MEGGGCTEWIFIDECDWRVIVRVVSQDVV